MAAYIRVEVIFLREQILYYALKYRGEYSYVHQAINRNEKWERIVYDDPFITILDEAYPKELFDLEDPPYILFYEGNLDLLKHPKRCVIGSRKCSRYAAQAVYDLIQTQKEEVVIVSGLARGVDGLAHEKAMELKRGTIGVIGCGCDQIYPKENWQLYAKMKKNELILSEYPNGCRPLAHHFPWRNRILAALGEVCYVVEAKSKSGTMITADYAQMLNREIIAFPYRYDDDFGRGCNELIEQGAGIFIK